MINGYKGFKKGLVCAPEGKPFQYEVGKTYEMEEPIKTCERGFHFCELPHQVFKFYPPGTSEFSTATGDGMLDMSEGDKVASSKISIDASISVFEIAKISVRCFFEKFKFKEKIEGADTNNAGSYGAANAGDCGAANAGNYGAANAGNYGAANAGDYGAANAGNYGAANAGNCGAANAGNYGAANAGYKGAAIVRQYGAASVGSKGVAVALGKDAKAKGDLSAVLVLTEWDKNGTEILQVKAVKVDGEKVKPGTYYALKNNRVAKAIGG